MNFPSMSVLIIKTSQIYQFILLQQDSIDLGSPSSASTRAERQLSNTSAFTEDSLNRCGSCKNLRRIMILQTVEFTIVTTSGRRLVTW